MTDVNRRYHQLRTRLRQKRVNECDGDVMKSGRHAGLSTNRRVLIVGGDPLVEPKENYTFRKICFRHKNQSISQQSNRAPNEYTREALATLNPSASRWDWAASCQVTLAPFAA